MNEPLNIPTSLRVVAILQLIMGVLSVIKFFVLLANGTFSIEFGILGIPIYVGLLRFRNGWRICALVIIWIGMIVTPIMFIISLAAAGRTHFQLFGVNVMRIPGWVAALLVIPFFLLVYWQYRVLTRPDIRRLFVQEPETPWQRREETE